MPHPETMRRLQAAIDGFCIATACLVGAGLLFALVEAAPRIAQKVVG